MRCTIGKSHSCYLTTAIGFRTSSRLCVAYKKSPSIDASKYILHGAVLDDFSQRLHHLYWSIEGCVLRLEIQHIKRTCWFLEGNQWMLSALFFCHTPIILSDLMCFCFAFFSSYHSSDTWPLNQGSVSPSTMALRFRFRQGSRVYPFPIGLSLSIQNKVTCKHGLICIHSPSVRWGFLDFMSLYSANGLYQWVLLYSYYSYWRLLHRPLGREISNGVPRPEAPWIWGKNAVCCVVFQP